MEEAIGWVYFAAMAGSMVWVFFDAPKRGMSRAWLAGLFFFWLLAFPAYLLARATKKPEPQARLEAAQTNQPVQGPSAPGWLPDPWFPGRFRYWDGGRWTSNSSDRPK